jgi:hypothetical protein
LRIKPPRAAGSSFRHGESFRKAFRAASTALSISPYVNQCEDRTKKKMIAKLTLVPSCTWQISSPVLGLMTGKVLPFTALCHSLLMKICVYLISIFGIVEVNAGIYNMHQDNLRELSQSTPICIYLSHSASALF